MDGVYYRIAGMDEARAAIRSIAPELRQKVLAQALRAGGVIVRSAVRAVTPVLNPAGWKRKRKGLYRPRYRMAGTLRKRISVRVSKEAKKSGNIGVFINVKPLSNKKSSVLKYGWASAQNPNDPFYWRFQNYGWNPASRALGGRLSAAGKRYRRRLIKAREVVSGRIAGKEFMEKGARALEPAGRLIISRITLAVEKMNSNRIKP